MKNSGLFPLFILFVVSAVLPMSRSVAQVSPPAARTAQRQRVFMPYLIGKDVGAAEQELKNIYPKFQIEKKAVGDSQRNPRQVVRQYPTAQTELSADTKIILYYRNSESKPKVDWGGVVGRIANEILRETEVPDVRGHSVREAKQMLRKSTLRAKFQLKQDDVDDLIVSAQSEPPGKKVRVNTSVRLTVEQPQSPLPSPRERVKSKQRPVPDVKGEKTKDARRIIEKAGFVVGEKQEEETSLKWGRVIDQAPQPGTRVNLGSPVNLVIAVRPKPVTVPDVRKLSLEQARQVLTAKGLKTGLVVGGSEDSPAAIVVNQFPLPGTSIERSSLVRLEVAAPPTPEPASFLVPDLRGQSRQEATLRLRGNSLQLGQVTTRPSNRPEGTVIEQQPAPNTMAAKGTVVNVILAAPLPTPTVTPGASPIAGATTPTPGAPTPRPTPTPTPTPATLLTVPDVRRKDLAEAINQLRTAKLEVGDVTQEDSTSAPNSVLMQQPAPGGRVAAGSHVNLVIAKATPSGGLFKEIAGIFGVAIFGFAVWGLAKLVRKMLRNGETKHPPPIPALHARTTMDVRQPRIESTTAPYTHFALRLLPKVDAGRQRIFIIGSLIAEESEEL